MPFAEYADFADCVRKNRSKKNPRAYCATIQKAAEEVALKIQERRVTEVFDLSEAEFETIEEAGGHKRLMATVRILKSGRSKNNRNYRPQALKEAVDQKLFDGIRMFINHDPSKPPMRRPMQEMASAIESTSYHEADKAIDARVEFFDEKFYDYTQRAKKYMGDSINALVRGTRIKGSDGVMEEDIQGIVQPRSVDWVIYPAAGGEILAFEGEDEGAEVDWDKLTLDELKKNAPHLITEMEAERPPDPDPDDDEKDDDEKDDEKDDDAAESLNRAAIEALVQEGVKSYIAGQEAEKAKKTQAAEKVRAKMATSGLPEKTRARVTASFEGATEYEEVKVQKAIDEAKEELKAVGAGPHITGNGPSAGSAANGRTFSVKEDVEAHFGVKPATKEASKEGAK